MKILQLTPAPQGTFLVWENGRKVPVMCFALASNVIARGLGETELSENLIYPCIASQNRVEAYTKTDAKVVL